jgi:hypothetical protein
MNHLDEGTIHAWLDGALDSAQSADVEAHVKGCAECSAKVAEARGLIAASSRILVALDDTPGNVIPKKAPVSAPARRRFSTASWVSGLAAAVVLVVLWRAGDVERPTVASDIRIPDITIPSSLPEPSLEQLKQPAPPPARPTAPAVAEQPQARVANRRQAGIGAVSGAGAGAPAVAAADLASAQVASAPAAVSATPEASRELSARRDEALKDEAVAVAGCYRLPEAAKLQFEAVVVTGAAEARAPEKMARTRGAVSAAAPAPAAVQKAADAGVVPGVVFKLDAQGLVRAVASDSIVGSWERIKPDSLRVRIGARTPVVSTADKVRCP